MELAGHSLAWVGFRGCGEEDVLGGLYAWEQGPEWVTGWPSAVCDFLSNPSHLLGSL